MKVCVTVDMDDFTEYEGLIGVPSSGSGASFYEDALPRFLDVLDRFGIRGTFFMIGRDARRPATRRRAREAAARGHEIGNHSYSHPYNFRSLPTNRKIAEIEDADSAIADAIGERPVGFRAPSCDADIETLDLLVERGYLYDSSVLSSWMMWLFMIYGKLFVRRADYQLGSLRAPLAPTHPYRPARAGLHRVAAPHDAQAPDILEIPFSVVPGLRIPFYSTFFRIFSPRLFEACVRLHGAKRSELHVLLHLIDLADLRGHALEAALSRTPGIRVGFERRQRFVARALRALAARGEPSPLRELAREVRAARAA